jgi:hypothetical protein
MNNLLTNETEITRSTNNSIVVTDSRVLQTIGKDIISIGIDKISCMKVRYSDQILLLVIGIVVALFGLGSLALGPDSEAKAIGGISLVIGLVFILAYRLSRKHVVSIISDCGHSINFLVTGLKSADIVAFINKVDQARIDYHKSNLERV